MDDSHILNIQETHDEDESIRSYQYYQYSPITGTSKNTPGEIRITIESQDEFFHPHNNYLLFTSKLVKSTAGAAYDNANMVSLTNNGIMFLFSSIKYELSGHVIECVNFPGQASTMQGLLKYSDDFSKSQGLNMCWVKDVGAGDAAAANKGFVARQKYIIIKPTPNGVFSFAIPLSHIFGFCEDYDKVVYGMKHMITLVRTDNDDAIFRIAAVGAGKVVLDEVSWYMPRVFPNDSQKLKLIKIIESKPTLDVGFRMRQCDTIGVTQTTSFTWRLSVRSAPERPRWIFIALQTDKSHDQAKNPAIFDHCNVTDMHVILNSDRYPECGYNASFTK